MPNVFPPRNDSKALVQNLPDLQGKSVLDVGTGSVVIGIFAAFKGAAKVVAANINPDAIAYASTNAQHHKVSDVISVHHSDLFDGISHPSKFALITANLPFRDKVAPDIVAASQ